LKSQEIVEVPIRDQIRVFARLKIFEETGNANPIKT